ncbi:inner membrane transport protein [Salmonella enterica subsp. enterica]|nr:inner membrane transport protein [Salmonella enterica subsp. enterica]
MNENIAEKFRADGVARPNWSAVFAVAFCVACLITVEFLPVSLLTPMAQDLGISEGIAGQSVTVTAFVAMFSSLFITQIIQATDRRYIVILFAVLLTASCLMVSFANSFTLLLLGRALSWVGAGRILGDVGVADHATGSRAYRAESAVGDFWRGLHRVSDRRAAGQFFGRYYWLA